MMASRLFASVPLTVTFCGNVLASFTSSAAGRACSPSAFTRVTLRE